MSYAAKIVVKKNSRGYEAGFSSKVRGTTIQEFGKWYGSQMGYRPFLAAMQAAEDLAEELNEKIDKK